VGGEPYSDHPQCLSPVMAAFIREWNGVMGDADRQILVPYILRLAKALPLLDRLIDAGELRPVGQG
jgi:hypothetical protein